MMVTLMTDLLVGVGVGLLLKVVLHLKNGAPLASLFRTVVAERRDGDTLHLEVADSAVFTNYLGLSQRLKSADDSVRRIVIELTGRALDHPARAKRVIFLFMQGGPSQVDTFDYKPLLQRDHGDVELADVQGKKIYVHLKGACSGCMMEAATLGGIQQKMIETLGELVQVLPSSHMPVEA